MTDMIRNTNLNVCTICVKSCFFSIYSTETLDFVHYISYTYCTPTPIHKSEYKETIRSWSLHYNIVTVIWSTDILMHSITLSFISDKNRNTHCLSSPLSKHTHRALFNSSGLQHADEPLDFTMATKNTRTAAPKCLYSIICPDLSCFHLPAQYCLFHFLTNPTTPSLLPLTYCLCCCYSV